MEQSFLFKDKLSFFLRKMKNLGIRLSQKRQENALSPKPEIPHLVFLGEIGSKDFISEMAMPVIPSHEGIRFCDETSRKLFQCKIDGLPSAENTVIEIRLLALALGLSSTKIVDGHMKIGGNLPEEIIEGHYSDFLNSNFI
jgi:hypothetical protein